MARWVRLGGMARTRDEGGVLGMAESSKAEHGVQRGEAGVAGADGVGALGLEVIQEGADEPGVEVLEL